jgi:hypothetical protein
VVRFPAGERDFSLLHSVETDSEAHPASYPMVTDGYLLELKLLRVNLPRLIIRGAMPPLLHTSSCHGA